MRDCGIRFVRNMTITRTEIFLALLSCSVCVEGILFPRESETREKVSLDGMWNFAVAPPFDPQIGFREKWYERDIRMLTQFKPRPMPVPSSYNDITTDPSIRDHVGYVWYQRTFFVPKTWANDTRVWLRFSAVSYKAVVWVNKNKVMTHEIGHLPFQSDITSSLYFGGRNQLTVACDNTLSSTTVPQGGTQEMKTDAGKKLLQIYSFDFFNYAGIHRPVTLYTTPLGYIDDVSIVTDIDGDKGHVQYTVSIQGDGHDAETHLQINILDKDGNLVGNNTISDSKGTITIENCKFWWPYLMDESPGYLYTLEIQLLHNSGDLLLDVYRQPFGIRTVTWNTTSLLINNKPVYLHGFGRHEDSDIRGKGLDLPIIARDYELIKWVGANVYRTSHYPYADETMDLADQMGIMIVDECPSVDTSGFTDALLAKHKQSLTELWKRDKNRPSVIVWSVANEPKASNADSDEYFEKIVAHVKSLDGNRRAVTFACSQCIGLDRGSKHMDIISWNAYRGWYTADLDSIVGNVVSDVEGWHKKYNKPVLMSEYGAPSISGFNKLPASKWSEDYHIELMSHHFEAFDKLRKKGFFVGEFIWNFADFQTKQGTDRAGGNKKGVFTRNRQPKASAHHLRRRYWSLAGQMHNVTPPTRIHNYVIDDLREEL